MLELIQSFDVKVNLFAVVLIQFNSRSFPGENHFPGVFKDLAVFQGVIQVRANHEHQEGRRGKGDMEIKLDIVFNFLLLRLQLKGINIKPCLFFTHCKVLLMSRSGKYGDVLRIESHKCLILHVSSTFMLYM